MLPTKSYHRGGKMYWFLVDIMLNRPAVMSITIAKETKKDLEKYAKMFFKTHNFKFFIAPTGFAIYASASKK